MVSFGGLAGVRGVVQVRLVVQVLLVLLRRRPAGGAGGSTDLAAPLVGDELAEPAHLALRALLAVPLQGGVPIEVDGHVIGAVGVSGATSADEDNELARIAAEAFAAEAVAA